MPAFHWRQGLQEKVDALCDVFPEVIRDRWKQRLICNAEKLTAYEGAATVTEDVFWRSVKEVFPGGYEPLILRHRDPAKMKEQVEAGKRQEELAPGTEPVLLTRWNTKPDCSAPVPPGKKILAVTSSARKGGNTDAIIDELLRACEDNGAVVEKFYLSDLSIKPCTGCRACRKADLKTVCALRDDMTAIMYDRIYAMDGFIMGFPIYTARENAIMANFMDRWDCFSNPFLSRGMPRNKKALVVCTWMWPTPTAYDNVIEQMVVLLRLHGVVTSDVLSVSGTRGKRHGKGVVKNHPEIMTATYSAGVNFLRGL